MVDVVLLTDRGIVFCIMKTESLDNLRATLQRTPDVIKLTITVTDEQGMERKHSVTPENILLGSSRR